MVALSALSRVNSTHSIYPARTFAKIASSSGKLIMGVPDSAMILELRASVSNR